MAFKIRVSIESVNKMQEFRQFVNQGLLSEIVWTLNGKILKIDPKIIEEFELTGLNNIDFITSGMYKKGLLTNGN